MEPFHLNFVILFLCFATTHVSLGYKPLRGTNENKISASVVPENPPAGHGRSVYDPEIYKKYTGIHFQDQITEEEIEEEKSPQMPSYPWRGGGHVPIALDDPESLNAKKTVEYLIGFRDCKEVLGEDAENVDDDEEEEDVKERTEPQRDERCCKNRELQDDEVSEYESLDIEETEQTEDTEENNDAQTSESKKKCKACGSSQEANNNALLGVGAVSVIGRDYIDDNTFIPDDNAAGDDPGGNFGGSDYSGGGHYPYHDNPYGDRDDDYAYGDSHAAGVGGDVIAILDGGTSSEPGEAGRGYMYRPYALPGDEEEGDEEEGDEEEGDEEGAQLKRLSPDGCRVCGPCCAYLAERATAKGVAVRSRSDECSPDDSEREFVGAECRACHVRRRPPHLGVVLTCYECATQQADRTCRLGADNVEHAHYRVSAKFFLTSQSNHTGEVTATQHSGMLDRQPREIPLQPTTSRITQRGHIISAPSFIDSDNKDLYPFEMEEQERDAAKDTPRHGKEEEQEE